MRILRQVGNSTNTPTNEYIAESLTELNEIKDKVPFGSMALIVDNSETKFYIMNSNKTWVEIK